MTECSDSWLQWLLAGIVRGPVIGVLADYCIVSSKAKKTIESPKQAAETHTHTHTHTLQKTYNWQKSNRRPAETYNTQHNKKAS